MAPPSQAVEQLLLLQAASDRLKQQHQQQQLYQYQQQHVVLVPSGGGGVLASSPLWSSPPLLVQPQPPLVSPLLSLLQQTQPRLSSFQSLRRSPVRCLPRSPDCLAILQRLGSQPRSGPFLDVLALPGFDQAVSCLENSMDTLHFPSKLYQMIAECSDDSVCRFVARGRAFWVIDKERFVQQVLPRYCKQTKWGSFQRQLHNYGFERIAEGLHQGAFCHVLFVQGQPNLVTLIKRVGIKNSPHVDAPNLAALRSAE